MSNDTSNTTTQSQASQATAPAKGKAPTHEIRQIVGEGDKAQFVKIGSLWEGKNESLSGNTVHGRMYIKSLKAEKALTEMRENKTQGQAVEQSQSQEPNM